MPCNNILVTSHDGEISIAETRAALAARFPDFVSAAFLDDILWAPISFAQSLAKDSTEPQDATKWLFELAGLLRGVRPQLRIGHRMQFKKVAGLSLLFADCLFFFGVLKPDEARTSPISWCDDQAVLLHFEEAWMRRKHTSKSSLLSGAADFALGDPLDLENRHNRYVARVVNAAAYLQLHQIETPIILPVNETLAEMLGTSIFTLSISIKQAIDLNFLKLVGEDAGQLTSGRRKARKFLLNHNHPEIKSKLRDLKKVVESGDELKQHVSETRRTKALGQIVEDVVARLHLWENATVQTRVKLPSRRNARSRREIDVLVTDRVGPYPVRLAIECKNEGKPVSIGEIGEFLDKLDDVGLPSRQAVFVSASGFQEGAMSRAIDMGLTPLALDGLTPDRLRLASRRAIALTIFLVPIIRQMSFRTDDKEMSPDELSGPFVDTPGLNVGAILIDQNGDFGGTIVDCIWKRWCLDKSLASIGLHNGVEPIPKGWGSVRKRHWVPVHELSFELEVEGHMLQREGQYSDAALRHAQTGEVFLSEVRANFETPDGAYDLIAFRTEESLEEHLSAQGSNLTISARVPVPRVMYAGPFGRFPSPPSDELVMNLSQAYRSNPKAWIEQSHEYRIPPVTEIAELFKAPSKMYVDGLRSRLGSAWPSALWNLVQA